MNAAHLSVARRVLVDVAFVWGTGRVVLLCVGVLAWPPLAPLVVALLVTALLSIQMRRGHEFVLIENLGIRPRTILTTALLFAVLLEAMLWTTLIATGIWGGPPEVS